MAERKNNLSQYVEDFVRQEFIGESRWVINTLCGTSNTNQLELKESKEYQLLLRYITCVVAKEHACITKGDKKTVREIKCYYACIYKFTKKNFIALSHSKIFGVLYKNFMNRGRFVEMTKTDKTLIRCPEKYLQGAQEILNEFEKQLKI